MTTFSETNILTTPYSDLNITNDINSIENAFAGERINGLDILVIVFYFISVLAVGIWSMWKTNRSTVGGYFLAGRNILWWPVGASLFSSNVGSGHFIGLAGTGAASGIAVGAYEWNAMFVVLLLAWVFLPVYIASGVVTMPEYLYKRYGGSRIQMCISVVYLFIYIFTKISVDLYAGAIFISQALKWDLYLCVFALLFVTAIYTVGGGLAAVIYTDTLQTFIMLIGAFILMVVGFINIGGYSGLVEKYSKATTVHLLVNNTECGQPRPDAFHVFRSVHSDLPWTGIVFGMPILSIWYWCTDQVIVQRTLAAKNLTHAKAGAVLCSYLKVLPMFLMVMVGMISRAKYPDEVACVDPVICHRICQNPRSCSDIAYPKLVMGILPAGARGLMIAVMLSALMSSLTSIFNSSSTIFTMDIWNRIRLKATEKELMVVGRVFVLILVVMSMVWIPIIQAEEGGQLFNYIQKISSYLQPPIAVCFILGIFTQRVNEKGAFWGLFVGTTVGVTRLAVDFVYPNPVCGEHDTRPVVVKSVHYLHFAVLLTILSTVVTVVVSLMTEPWPKDVFGGLTWKTRNEMLSENPMHLHNNKPKTELSKLVEHDLLAQEENHLSNQVNINKIDDFVQDNVEQTSDTYQEIDLGRHRNLAAPRARNSHRIDVKYIGSSVEFISRDTGNSEIDIEDANTRIWDKLFGFLCGYNTTKQKPFVQSTISINTLSENVFWNKVVNINLIVCILFSLSLWIAFR